MHRNNLINLLNKYNSNYEEEVFFKEQILKFINENENCFHRELEIGHITSSCWLINSDKTKALLTHHSKLNKWFQLGGHCDGDCNVLNVALKEAVEESGIEEIIPFNSEIFDIDVHLIPESKKEKAHYHYDIRFLLLAKNENFIISKESKELKWIDKDIKNLPTYNKAVIRMFNKWINL